VVVKGRLVEGVMTSIACRPDVSEARPARRWVDDLALGLGDAGCVTDYPAAPLVVPVAVDVDRARLGEWVA
jgi:hypothetical protein